MFTGNSSDSQTNLPSEQHQQPQLEEMPKGCSTPIRKGGNLSLMLSNEAFSNDFAIDSPPTYKTMNMEEINELLPKSSENPVKSPESNKSNEAIEHEEIGDIEKEPFEDIETHINEGIGDNLDLDENDDENEQEAELKIPLKVNFVTIKTL